MTSNVTVEEARALLGALSEHEPAPSVSVRRFDQPLRLPEPELEALRVRVAGIAPELERELALAWRMTPKLEVLEVAEIGVDGLAASLGAAPLVLRFEIAGEPGWLTWERIAALRLVESALGSNPGDVRAARELSSVERALAQRWLTAVATRIARSLDLTADGFRLVQMPELIGSWRDGGARADASRLHVRVELTGASEPSALRLYLPGVMRAPDEKPAATAAALPAHAANVEIELRAELGASEVPVSQLMALEVGDVIPLGVPAGETVAIKVEEHTCMRGVLGRVRGNLALCVKSIERATTN